MCIYIHRYTDIYIHTALAAQLVNNLPVMQETWVRSQHTHTHIYTLTKLSNDKRTLFCGSSKCLGKTSIPFSLVSDETSY